MTMNDHIVLKNYTNTNIYKDHAKFNKLYASKITLCVIKTFKHKLNQEELYIEND